MPVFNYLDLSTSHLTEAEMDAVNGRLAELECNSPRVIRHEYGAWVNVQSSEPSDTELAASYPNLAACLNRAHELNCAWINFDQDASTDETLPTYEW